MLVPLIQIIKYSIVSAITMSLAAMALQMSGFTKLDMGTYLGCLLTGKNSGMKSFVLSLLGHFFAAIFIAYLYVQAMTLFDLSLSLKTACILGLANTFFSGIFVKGLDMVNPCVEAKKMQGMGFFASGYGINGIISYALIHVVFAVTFLKLLGAPFSL